MTRLWNYLYYATYQVLLSGNHLIVKLVEIMIIQFLPKRLKKRYSMTKSFHNELMYGEVSTNSGFAKSFMLILTYGLLATICFDLIIMLDLHKTLNLKGFYSIQMINITLISIAVLINYLTTWRRKKYRAFFEEFGKNQSLIKLALNLFLFWFGSIVFGLLSIYLTIGFK